MTDRLRRDDRAVSIAVTHVLTIAVTTLIIGGLMMGSGHLLETEKEGSAEDSLETIGERLSSQLSSVDRVADEGGNVTVRADHPRTVAGSAYTVELYDHPETCSEQPLLNDTDQCLILSYHGGDVDVGVPVSTSYDVTNSSTRGGTVRIHWDGDEENISIGGTST